MIGKIDNPRAEFNKPIDQLQKEFMNDDFRDHYSEIFTGKVINNNDPLKLGRCRIRVYGLFDDTIPDGELPWAMPDMQFIGSKVGSFVVPPVDAIVCVYFDKGDIYCPRYTTKVVDKANLPTQRNTNYPDNMVLWETDDGDYFTVNRQTKEITISHNSGSKITMKIDGSIEIVATTTATIKSPIVQIENTGAGGVVSPNPAGGPFCGLPVCLLTGAPHQGFTVVNS